MPPGAASRVGGQENSFHRAEVRKGFSDRLLRQFCLWGVVVLELVTVNSSGGVRVCWGVYGAGLSRSGEPAGHGGGQFNSIEMTAVEMITCQSVQSQLQVQQWLVNRSLYLGNARETYKWLHLDWKVQKTTGGVTLMVCPCTFRPFRVARASAAPSSSSNWISAWSWR